MRRSRMSRVALVAAMFGGAIAGLAACTTADDPAPPLPKVDAISEARSASALQAEIDSSWSEVTARYPDAVRPEVSVVRLVTPTEQPRVVADCLNQVGFTGSKATSDGGILYGDVPANQESAFALSLYTCRASYPINPVYNQAPNEEQTRYIYYYWTHKLTSCLESRGVPVSDAPSFTVFEQIYGTKKGWDPYSNTAVTQREDAAKIVKACPLYPANYYSAGVRSR